jgi:hypothetical protein
MIYLVFENSFHCCWNRIMVTWIFYFWPCWTYCYNPIFLFPAICISSYYNKTYLIASNHLMRCTKTSLENSYNFFNNVNTFQPSNSAGKQSLQISETFITLFLCFFVIDPLYCLYKCPKKCPLCISFSRHFEMRSFNNSKQNIATKQRVVGNQCALINDEYFLIIKNRKSYYLQS